MASAGQVQAAASATRLPLRVASYVVEMEIFGQRKAETYDKEIGCDLPDPRQQRLGRIAEDAEFDNFNDDFDARFDSMRQMQQQETRPARRSSHL